MKYADGDGQGEPTRTSAAWIEIEDFLAMFDRWLV
jgi:hypothetical protein